MALFVLCIIVLYLYTFFSYNKETDVFSKEKIVPLKGILALLIVAHHLSSSAGFLSCFHSWGAPIVSIFLFISGYGVMRSFALKGDAYLQGFFRKRILNGILIPFLLSWVVYKIVFWNYTPDVVETVSAFLKLGIVTLPHSWYVYAILLFYILFYISCKCSAKYSLPLIMGLFVCYVVMMMHVGYARCWYISSLAFPFGTIYARYENKFTRMYQHPALYKITVPVLLVLMGLLFLLQSEFSYIFVYVLIPLTLCCLFAKIKIEKLNKVKSLQFLSGISYEIYLCQGISMTLLRGPYLHLDSDILYVVFTYSITILLALAVKQARRNFVAST